MTDFITLTDTVGRKVHVSPSHIGLVHESDDTRTGADRPICRRGADPP